MKARTHFYATACPINSRFSQITPSSSLTAFCNSFSVPKIKGFSFAGKWLDTAGHILGVTQEDNVIRGIREEDTKGEKFDGILCNHAAQIKFYGKESRWGSGSLLGSGAKLGSDRNWGSSKNGFLYIEEDGKQMNIHLADETESKFLVLTRGSDHEIKTLSPACSKPKD